MLTMAHLRLVANLFYVTQAMLVSVLVGSGSGTQKHALAVQATILKALFFIGVKEKETDRQSSRQMPKARIQISLVICPAPGGEGHRLTCQPRIRRG